jgi:hypothetical protein
VTCPCCFKSFNTVSALAQHTEDEGSKCRVHTAGAYRAYTDQLTSGLVDLDGHHLEDGTNKYVISEKAAQAFAGVGNPLQVMRDRLRKTEEEERAKQETHWDRNEPIW